MQDPPYAGNTPLPPLLNHHLRASHKGPPPTAAAIACLSTSLGGTTPSRAPGRHHPRGAPHHRPTPKCSGRRPAEPAWPSFPAGTSGHHTSAPGPGPTAKTPCLGPKPFNLARTQYLVTTLIPGHYSAYATDVDIINLLLRPQMGPIYLQRRLRCMQRGLWCVQRGLRCKKSSYGAQTHALVGEPPAVRLTGSAVLGLLHWPLLLTPLRSLHFDSPELQEDLVPVLK